MNDIKTCENCKFGNSPCDWCAFDRDGMTNFVPKKELNEVNVDE